MAAISVVVERTCDYGALDGFQECKEAAFDGSRFCIHHKCVRNNCHEAGKPIDAREYPTAPSRHWQDCFCEKHRKSEGCKFVSWHKECMCEGVVEPDSDFCKAHACNVVGCKKHVQSCSDKEYAETGKEVLDYCIDHKDT